MNRFIPFLFFFILLGPSFANSLGTDECRAPLNNTHNTSTAQKSGVWSDLAIWDIPPRRGSKINIPPGITVWLDKSIYVASIDIYGTFQVQDSRDISITAGFIMAYGLCATALNPTPYLTPPASPFLCAQGNLDQKSESQSSTDYKWNCTGIDKIGKFKESSVSCDLPITSINGTQVYGNVQTTVTTVNGKPVPANTQITGGTFEAGTAQSPFTHHLTITLNGLDANAVGVMGGRVLGAMNGGRILLFGHTPTVKWTSFKNTVPAGIKSIRLQGVFDWHIGDHILIATPFYPAGTIDTHIITGISKNGSTLVISVDSPLLYTYDGGQVSLAPKPVWTMLNATAHAGSKIITLQDSVDWQVGDKIIITSTDFPGIEPAAEERTITKITNNDPNDIKPSVVTLDNPLNYQHYGRIQYFKHQINPCPIGIPTPPGGTCTPTDLDERAEVGLLTHNIVIQGSSDSVDAEGNAVPLTVKNLTPNSNKISFSTLQGSTAQIIGYGGHTMIMGDGSIGVMQGVELFHMGQNGITARYPIHWHALDTANAIINPHYNGTKDNYADLYLRGSSASSISYSSMHDCFQRFVAVHRTSYISVHDNVGFNTNGHGYFIEDGKEVGNVFIHNLGAQLNNGSLLTSRRAEQSDLLPTIFWTSNPNNDYINNAAAGGLMGFWYDIPLVPPSDTISSNPTACLNARVSMISYNRFPRNSECYSPSSQLFGIFIGNRAHSNGKADPLKNDLSLVNFDTASLRIEGVINMPLPNLFSDMTVFKTPLGIWGIGDFSQYLYRWHLEAPMVTQAGNKFIKSSLLVNTDRTDNNPVIINNSMAHFNYDGTTSGTDDVYIGYKSLIQYLSAPSSPGNEFYLHSQFIDTPLYTPSTEHFEDLDEMIPDMDNSVGNGIGAFVNQPWNIDSACKGGDALEGRGKGALGIDPSDAESYWCPYIYGGIDFLNPGKQWLIAQKQNGNYVPIKTVHRWDTNTEAWIKTNQLYWIKPLDGENNIDSFNFNALATAPIYPASSAPLYPPAGTNTSQLTESIVMPLPDKPFYLIDNADGKNHAVYKAKSIKDFNSKSGEAWFIDLENKYLYLKAPYNFQANIQFIYTPYSIINTISRPITIASGGIDSLCGVSANSCAVGNLEASSKKSSFYYSTWNCNGINGGKKQSCLMLLPINASCGAASTCVIGKTGYPSIAPGSKSYIWKCQGYFGGTSQNCSLPIT